jgi:hypothetical protein
MAIVRALLIIIYLAVGVAIGWNIGQLIWPNVEAAIHLVKGD